MIRRLAGAGAGDEQRFGQIMTQQARLLGMSNTTFRNASGLPDPSQVSTARDFATLARHLIRDFPDQYHYFSVPAFMFHGRYIGNHDSMLRSYPGADGLKTGYTIDAGHNLVSSAVRGNVRLVGVVLGAHTNPQRSAMMSNILDAAFQQEGVPIMTRAAPRVFARHDRGAMMLVADTPAAGPIVHGHHRSRHGWRARAARLVHLTGARVHLTGARFRRALAHGHRPGHLRMTSLDSQRQDC